MNEDIILKADNLFFSYDNEKTHSLNGLSLEIKRGHKIAFMGANGSGKSTFFLCCNGIHQPSSGTLYFNGEPVDYSRKGLLKLRSKVGIVFQDPDNQLFSASVYQEISFGILNLGVPEDEAKEQVEQVIDYLEITPFRHKPTHALSGGQKKQVSIADILVMNPDIIILDEPAAALDPKHTTMVNKIVDQLTENGITVMMATHDVNYAMAWADDVFLFKDGKVLIHGTPEQVFSNKSALASTNLEQPACLQLFDSLCKKGILKTSLPIPHSLQQLESYIAAISERTYHGGKIMQESKKAILVVSFGTSYSPTSDVFLFLAKSGYHLFGDSFLLQFLFSLSSAFIPGEPAQILFHITLVIQIMPGTHIFYGSLYCFLCVFPLFQFIPQLKLRVISGCKQMHGTKLRPFYQHLFLNRTKFLLRQFSPCLQMIM